MKSIWINLNVNVVNSSNIINIIKEKQKRIKTLNFEAISIRCKTTITQKLQLYFNLISI